MKLAPLRRNNNLCVSSRRQRLHDMGTHDAMSPIAAIRRRSGFAGSGAEIHQARLQSTLHLSAMVLHADALWLLLQGERMLRVSQHSARPPSHAGQAQRPSLLVPYTTQAAGPFRKTLPSALGLRRDLCLAPLV